MIKKLLSASLLGVFALSASAYNEGEYVFTKTAKYQIAGENLVKNGKFTEGNTGMDGWTATVDSIALDAVFEMKTGGPNNSNTQAVIEGANTLDHGMYQAIDISAGGTYVVTFRMIGTTAGYTDLDLTGGSINYINAYYNTDGALAICGGDKNEELTFGENGVGGGYQFSFGSDGFTEITFAVDAPAEGKIIIDFRGLVNGIEIADVECHLANQVYDSRIAERRVAYLQKYLGFADLSSREWYEDLQIAITDVNKGIANNSIPEEMETLMGNLESAWEEFAAVNFGNIIDFVPTTNGSAATGNSSANWMNWTGKYNKLSSNYNGKAPWEWSTDRWCHKGTTEGSPMAIQWMRGTSGPYNNIATLTVELEPGDYFWGVSGEGGMMTLNKERWARSWGNECAATQLFFGADTTEAFILDPAIRQDYVYKFTVAGEAGVKQAVRVGIICNTTVEHKEGFDVQFYSPVLYKLLEEGALTPEQELYLSNVAAQLEVLKGRIDVANGYLAEDQVLMPWGKADLKAGVDETQVRYDGWTAMTQDEILEKFDLGETLADTIMNNGVRYINNNYITPFLDLNKPLTDMPTTIESATYTKGLRIYSSSSKMSELTQKIADAQALYDTSLKAEYAEEVATALVNMKAELDALVEEFKKAITTEIIVDIDFGTQEAPATIVTHEDPEALVDTYYTIDGAKGTMKLTDITGTYKYELGLNATDSLGMLRVGNSEATVDFTGTPAKATDIVNIQFDYYFGNLTKCKAGFKVLGAEYMVEEVAVRDTVCGLFCSMYDGNDNLNSFGINYTGHLVKVGSSGNDNAKIAAASNKSHFDVVLDYGAEKMYVTTTSSKGTHTTEMVALPKVTPAQFVLYSNYSNVARRCWFDNLIIQNIAAGVDTGINEVQNAVVTKKNTAIYNLAGQRIAAPVKGQIYIQNGKKYIGK